MSQKGNRVVGKILSIHDQYQFNIFAWHVFHSEKEIGVVCGISIQMTTLIFKYLLISFEKEHVL